jgi:hypothetical protein
MFRRRRSSDDFAEEIKSHFELEADELQSEGLSEEEARRRARVEFGNAQTAQERFYLSSRIVWFDNLLHDIKFAIRQLIKKRLHFRTWTSRTFATARGASPGCWLITTTT